MGDPSQFQGRIICMSMFNDIIWVSEDNERECVANATLVTLFAKRFPAGRWSLLGLASETKWYSTYIDRPQGEWDRVVELMMIKFRESGHPVSRATSLVSRGTLKSKGGVKLSIHFCADGDTVETDFSTIISVNELGIYGAVSNLCDEDSACHARTVRPVLAGQSDPLFEPARLLITTPTPSTEVPAQENLLQKYTERVDRLSQQDRWLKICTDAGFLTTVEVWTVFHDKARWRVLTIKRTSDMSWAHFATRWKINWPERLDSREHQKWTRCWKSQPVTCKVNMEWKSELNL